MSAAPAQRAEAVAEHRALLWRIAYRMLGSASDADDVLQEVALRWLAVDPRSVHQPRAFLIAVCSRLCISQIRRAKRARETYVGPWLPEPAADDRADDVSLGYLMLLQRLKTSERTVLVLHEAVGLSHGEIAAVLGRSPEACRKALSRAKRRLQATDGELSQRPVSLARIAQFRAALASEDARRLVALLADDALLVSDGGGRVVAARRPIASADRVARFLCGVWRKLRGRLAVEKVRTNGADALLVRAGGAPFSLIVLEGREGGAVARILMLRNPDKLRRFAKALEGRP